jgi:hypothetical protein
LHPRSLAHGRSQLILLSCSLRSHLLASLAPARVARRYWLKSSTTIATTSVNINKIKSTILGLDSMTACLGVTCEWAGRSRKPPTGSDDVPDSDVGVCNNDYVGPGAKFKWEYTSPTQGNILGQFCSSSDDECFEYNVTENWCYERAANDTNTLMCTRSKIDLDVKDIGETVSVVPQKPSDSFATQKTYVRAKRAQRMKRAQQRST